MRRIPLFAVLLLLTTRLFAQADVGVSLERLESGPAFEGQPYTYALTVANAGPQAAHDVVVHWWFADAAVPQTPPDPRCAPFQGNGYLCTFNALAVGESVRLTSGAFADLFAVGAEIKSAADADPNTANNFFGLSVFPIHLLSDLGLNITLPERINPDATATFRYSIKNQTPGRWTVNVKAKIGLTQAIGIVSSNAPCVLSTAQDLFAECTLPTLAPEQTFDLDLTVRFPTPDGRIETTLTPVWADIGLPGATIRASNVYPRTFAVTNASDAGAGSLRQALLDANAQCPLQALPCTIAMAIADTLPAEGWYTIHVATPLPGITTQQLTIDASGQAVLLDGSALAAGNGLLVRASGTTIRGLAIGNFPDNGIFVLRLAPEVGTSLRAENNFIGVTPGGTPAPNLRGIMVPHGGAAIAHNVIAANRYSGIYAWNGSFEIDSNRIERNGASGIYLGPNALGTVTQNSIEHNRDFGIATAPEPFTRVSFAGNRIQANGHAGIDIGIDGPTLDEPTTMPPVIDAAYYDGRHTYVLGHTPAPVDGQISTRYFVELFANEHEPAQGERPLAANIPVDEEGRFAIVFSEQDLRGLSINGIGTRRTTLFGELTYYQSSEFGRVRKVE